MALRKRHTPNSAPTVPDELVHPDEPLWRDLAASRAWFRRHNIPTGHLFDAGPANRRKLAIEGWALRNGYHSEQFPRLLDHHKLNTLPIEHHDYVTDATHEQLAAVCEITE